MNIAVQLSSLPMSFSKALHTVAGLGVRGVEIDARGELSPGQLTRTAVRQVRKMLEDANVRVVAVGFLTRHGYHVAEGLERRVEATRQAMQLARELGASIVINHVGRVPAETSDPNWELLREVLTDLGRDGQRIGALLAASTGSESGAALASLIDALPPGSLVANLDPGRLVMNGHSPVEAVAALGSHIVHVHACDGVRDLGQGRGFDVPLGRGSVDFPAICAALEERSYRGYYTIKRETAENASREIEQAIAYLKNMWS